MWLLRQLTILYPLLPHLQYVSHICLSGRSVDISAIDLKTDVSKMSTKFLIEPSYDNHSTQCCSYLFYRTSHGSCSRRMVLFANAILYLNECNVLLGTGWWCLVWCCSLSHHLKYIVAVQHSHSGKIDAEILSQ